MTIALRPATDEDEPFLCRLFHSWKAQDLGLAMLPSDILATLLDMQWRAHCGGIRAAHPQADKHVVVVDGEAVGVMVLDHEPGVLHLCEIAFMPQWRGHGLGTQAIRHAQEKARAAGAKLHLHVNRLNPAQNLYRRLGFVERDDGGAQLPMVWSGTNG